MLDALWFCSGVSVWSLGVCSDSFFCSDVSACLVCVCVCVVEVSGPCIVQSVFSSMCGV